jgi:hypothetical protein
MSTAEPNVEPERDDEPPEHDEAAFSHSLVLASGREPVMLPVIPSKDEFLSLALQAKLFAEASVVPKDLRGKPWDILAVLMVGRDLGIPVTAALRRCYVIDGMVTIAPSLRLAKVRQAGAGRVVPHPENSNRWAGALALDPHNQPLGPVTVFTWDDAATAGLVDFRCTPDEHFEPGGTNQYGKPNRCACKNNWRTYPKRMLWWRAAGYCVDDYFPEVGMGVYSPDELGAMTDEDGVPIDVTSVEVPEWARAPEAVVRLVAEDEVVAIEQRIARLDAMAREDLKVEWRERNLSPLRRDGMLALKLADRAFVLAIVSRQESTMRRDGRPFTEPPDDPIDASTSTSAHAPAHDEALPDDASPVRDDERDDETPDDGSTGRGAPDTPPERLIPDEVMQPQPTHADVRRAAVAEVTDMPIERVRAELEARHIAFAGTATVQRRFLVDELVKERS